VRAGAPPSSRTRTVSEWESRVFPELRLRPDDRAVADALRAGSRAVVEELREGLRIAARSWAGVVRFREFELHILPKLAGENLGLVGLIDYVAGIDALKRIRSNEPKSIHAAGGSLVDLISLLLAESCERLVRGGIHSDYVETEGDLPVLRGRLLADRQLIRRHGRVDRLECRYDEFTSDILENQILLGALALCSRVVRHPAVALRVRRLHKLFDEQCSAVGLDFRRARQDVSYHRLNEAYKEPHELAWLVAEALGVDDPFARGAARCFCFLFDMNRLFEMFVAKWVRWVLSEDPVRVRVQRPDRSIIWDVGARAPYRRVVPDILLEPKSGAGPRLPVDAKYKLYDERKVASGDIYQTFLYSFAYGAPPAQRAVLVHPASGPTPRMVRLEIRGHGGSTAAEIRVVGVHIPSALGEATSCCVGPQSQMMRQALLARQ